MIGVFAGVLNGAAFGRDVIDHRVIHDQPTNTGQAIFVMRPTCSGRRTPFSPRWIATSPICTRRVPRAAIRYACRAMRPRPRTMK